MPNLFILLALSVCVQVILYKYIKAKQAYHTIYQLGPSTHQKKVKTPSFGGVGMLISLLIGLFFLNKIDIRIIWLMGLIVLYGLIGFLDDFLAFKNNQNCGLSPMQKFSLQVVLGILALLSLFFLGYKLSFITIGFYLFVLIGTSNATNLTDGLDGLLAGASLISISGFMAVFYGQKDVEMLSFLIVLFSAVFGFFTLNLKPAKIFMGDTGSLALGAAFAGLAILLENPWILLPLGAVYIIETGSVIIQVVFYKWKQKRVFKMAPLHHHFELLGVPEMHVVLGFWGLCICFIITLN